jgi:delta-aminolevulinic acid dehydratase/porphobilinogen synthase
MTARQVLETKDKVTASANRYSSISQQTPDRMQKKNHEYLVKFLFCCAEFTVCGFCCVLAAGESMIRKILHPFIFTCRQLI